jgi:hypothetical protein
MLQQYIRILLILGMLAAVCGTVSASVGVIAETQTIGIGVPPVCTAPCECISENEAAQRWGTEGYERCSKTICGQSPNADIPYYCLHQVGGTTSQSLTSCQAPCECMGEGAAQARWGANGYTQCSKTMCGQDATTGGTFARYCFRQWGSTLVIGGAATTVPATVSQATVQPPAQTLAQMQQPAQTGAAAPATPTPSYNWPSPGAVQQRTPVGVATILAAIGAASLAAAGMRRK